MSKQSAYRRLMTSSLEELGISPIEDTTYASMSDKENGVGDLDTKNEQLDAFAEEAAEHNEAMDVAEDIVAVIDQNHKVSDTTADLIQVSVETLNKLLPAGISAVTVPSFEDAGSDAAKNLTAKATGAKVKEKIRELWQAFKNLIGKMADAVANMVRKIADWWSDQTKSLAKLKEQLKNTKSTGGATIKKPGLAKKLGMTKSEFYVNDFKASVTNYRELLQATDKATKARESFIKEHATKPGITETAVFTEFINPEPHFPGLERNDNELAYAKPIIGRKVVFTLPKKIGGVFGGATKTEVRPVKDVTYSETVQVMVPSEALQVVDGLESLNKDLVKTREMARSMQNVRNSMRDTLSENVNDENVRALQMVMSASNGVLIAPIRVVTGLGFDLVTGYMEYVKLTLSAKGEFKDDAKKETPATESRRGFSFGFENLDDDETEDQEIEKEVDVNVDVNVNTDGAGEDDESEIDVDTEAPIEGELTSPEDDLADVEQAEAEVDTVDAEADLLVDADDMAEEVVEDIEAIDEVGDEEAELIEQSVEALNRKLAPLVGAVANPSIESLGSRSSRRMRARLTAESIKEKRDEIWAKIKKVLAALWNRVTDFFRTVVQKVTNSTKRQEKILASLKELSGSEVKSYDQSGLVAALSVGGKFPDAADIKNGISDLGTSLVSIDDSVAIRRREFNALIKGDKKLTANATKHLQLLSPLTGGSLTDDNTTKTRFFGNKAFKYSVPVDGADPVDTIKSYKVSVVSVPQKTGESFNSLSPSEAISVTEQLLASGKSVAKILTGSLKEAKKASSFKEDLKTIDKEDTETISMIKAFASNSNQLFVAQLSQMISIYLSSEAQIINYLTYTLRANGKASDAKKEEPAKETPATESHRVFSFENESGYDVGVMDEEEVLETLEDQSEFENEEADDAVAYLDSQTEELDTVVDTMTESDELIERVEDIAQSGGLDAAGAEFVEASVERMNRALNIQTPGRTVPSFENFGGSSERRISTQITIESLKERAAKIWVAILKALREAGQRIVTAINSIRQRFRNNEKHAQSLLKKLEGAGEVSAKEITNPSLAARLAIGNSVPRASTIVDQLNRLSEFAGQVKESVTYKEQLARDIIDNPADYEKNASKLTKFIQPETMKNAGEKPNTAISKLLNFLAPKKASQLSEMNSTGVDKDNNVYRTTNMMGNKYFYLVTHGDLDQGLKTALRSFNMDVVADTKAKAPETLMPLSVSEAKSVLNALISSSKAIDTAMSGIESVVKNSKTLKGSIGKKDEVSEDYLSTAQTLAAQMPKLLTRSSSAIVKYQQPLYAALFAYAGMTVSLSKVKKDKSDK